MILQLPSKGFCHLGFPSRPSQLHCSETLSSLRFAARAKKIENMATWRNCLFVLNMFVVFVGKEPNFWVGEFFVCIVLFPISADFGVFNIPKMEKTRICSQIALVCHPVVG